MDWYLFILLGFLGEGFNSFIDGGALDQAICTL